MWREFIEGFGLTCTFGIPATPEEIDNLEVEVGLRLPLELRELLSEANGIAVKPRFSGDPGPSALAVEEGWQFSLTWSITEIAEQISLFHSWNDAVPPPGLIPFGSQPNGDTAALRSNNDGDCPYEVVMINHEDWRSCQVIATSMREYLAVFLEACQ